LGQKETDDLIGYQNKYRVTILNKSVCIIHTEAETYHWCHFSFRFSFR